MNRYAPEPLTATMVSGELAPLLRAHYEEVALNRDRIKLAPMWERYFMLQNLGLFKQYTARDAAGTLVGYNWFIVDRHLHYEDTIVASNDIFYIVPEHRSGMTAFTFLRYTERQLRALGVHKVAYHYKAANNFGPILKRLGYSHEEGVAAKLL